MGGFGHFIKSTLLSNRHPEILPLVTAIGSCVGLALFFSFENLFYNPTVVALKSEREQYRLNQRERDYEPRPFIKLVRPLRDHPINVFQPFGEGDERDKIPH
eukprot:jgi/Galph1/2270/GphlegSOOS_G925.1